MSRECHPKRKNRSHVRARRVGFAEHGSIVNQEAAENPSVGPKDERSRVRLEGFPKEQAVMPWQEAQEAQQGEEEMTKSLKSKTYTDMVRR